MIKRAPAASLLAPLFFLRVEGEIFLRREFSVTIFFLSLCGVFWPKDAAFAKIFDIFALLFPKL